VRPSLSAKRSLDSAARHLAKAPDPADVRFLAAEPFGKAILDAVRSASNSIWISAYYFNDSRASPIKDFYAALGEKASAGVEVVILAENSTASPPAMRRANANFADALAQAGIQASLWSGTNRSLHKKLVVVDGPLRRPALIRPPRPIHYPHPGALFR
jgi:phosphatidylserine/phosphatidylglycerophosphate/cardiolipin synthase-like enzyme